MVLIKNEVTLMYKIFWSHVFALGIILSITFFHADSNGLMNDVLFSLLTVKTLFYEWQHLSCGVFSIQTT